MSAPVGRWLLVGLAVVVLAAIAAAVATMGSPADQREHRIDERRIRDLQQIESAVDAYVSQRGRLPESLAALASQPGVSLAIADPQTAAPYEYATTGARNYRLCAVFVTDTAQRDPDGASTASRWAHGAGRQCYTRRSKIERE